MSTFRGLMREIPHVSVDKFTDENLRSTAFFLSHAHKDHMDGLRGKQFYDHLENAEMEGVPVFLYCSQITRLYLINMGFKKLDKYIKVLELGTSMIEVHSPIENGRIHTIAVSCLSAGHCPGSFMFLFENEEYNVLYTGDFRVTSSDITKFSPLCDGFGLKKIHTLYLDSTFFDKSYYYFPSRAESAAALCEVLKEWISKSPIHVVLLDLPAHCGSEYLFTKIRRNLGLQVHVQFSKYRQYEGIEEIVSCLTNNGETAKVHACCYRDEVRGMALPCCRGSFHVLIVKPSAMWYKSSAKGHKPLFRYFNGGYSCQVAHSCHASYKELVDVINTLKPCRIYPTAIPPGKARKKVIERLNKVMTNFGENHHMLSDSSLSDSEMEHSEPHSEFLADSVESQLKTSLCDL